MRKLVRAAALALSIVVLGATAASACHFTEGHVQNDCSGSIAYGGAVDAKRSNEYVTVKVDGALVATIPTNLTAAFSGTASTFSPNVSHTVLFDVYLGSSHENSMTRTTTPVQGCKVDVPWKLRLQMMNHQGGHTWSGSVAATPGSAVTVDVVRAAKYFKARIVIDGQVVFSDKLLTTSERSRLRLDVLGIHLDIFARLSGKSPESIHKDAVV